MSGYYYTIDKIDEYHVHGNNNFPSLYLYVVEGVFVPDTDKEDTKYILIKKYPSKTDYNKYIVVDLINHSTAIIEERLAFVSNPEEFINTKYLEIINFCRTHKGYLEEFRGLNMAKEIVNRLVHTPTFVNIYNSPGDYEVYIYRTEDVARNMWRHYVEEIKEQVEKEMHKYYNNY